MSDWDEFSNAVPWFLAGFASVQTEPEVAAAGVIDVGSPFADTFPDLANLLTSARITPVTLQARRRPPRRYRLFAWQRTNGRPFGWLSPAPPVGVCMQLHRDHELLLGTFGGVTERFNEPEDTWLLNGNEALTVDAAGPATSLTAFDDARATSKRSHGRREPIELSEYYAIAVEANGNTTLCHRTTGGVLMFAPDHSFSHIRRLDGWPEYTFYQIPSAPVFRDWVETIARQWVRHVASAPPGTPLDRGG